MPAIPPTRLGGNPLGRAWSDPRSQARWVLSSETNIRLNESELGGEQRGQCFHLQGQARACPFAVPYLVSGVRHAVGQPCA